MLICSVRIGGATHRNDGGEGTATAPSIISRMGDGGGGGGGRLQLERDDNLVAATPVITAT